MNSKEALRLTLRVLGLYPSSAREGDLTVGAWTAEFAERFAAYPIEVVEPLAIRFCRENAKEFAPSCPQLCEWVMARLREVESQRATQERLALGEFTEDQCREAKRRIRGILDGLAEKKSMGGLDRSRPPRSI